MPDWRFHIGVAEDICEVLKIENVELFVLGSLTPDVPWMSLEDAIMRGHREKTHYAVSDKGQHIDVPRVEAFLVEHSKDVAISEFWQGYLSHIILDRNVNTTWRAIEHEVGFNRFQIPSSLSNVPVDIGHVAKLKWNDTDNYARYKYGHVMSEQWKSDEHWKEPCEVWQDCFNVSPFECMGGIHSIAGTLDKDPEMVVRRVMPLSVYDAIVYQTIRECEFTINRLKELHYRGLL